ncbi:hypothetical protein [Cellulosimicrobium funkei]|uniref:hypothetical protein n=1 Tax=Cellulosimicrobium funkei TaxID=264251 RepID=UPI0037DD8D78
MDSPHQDADSRRFLALMSLHKYFLNASLLRDIFQKRLGAKPPEPTAHGHADDVAMLDTTAAMSLWYATLYVVIEGWRDAGLSDPSVDALLKDDLTDRLRVFRNQTFHYQKTYDNPRLLEFLGTGDEAAARVTAWVQQTHNELGRAIVEAISRLVPSAKGTGNNHPL